jgi:NitT/TauT family transport system substrate-binding protein
MTPNDVNVVSLDMFDHEAVHSAGKVDAVVTFCPARIQLLKAGAKPPFESGQTQGEIVDTMAASSDAITNNRESLQTLVEARFKALDYFESNPAEASLKMAKRSHVKPEDLLGALHLLKQPSLALSMGTLVRVMHGNGLIARMIDPPSLLDAQFVECLASRR